MYYVYVLRSERDGRLYIGFTNNLEKRLELHNSAKVESTKHRAPFNLIYYEANLCKDDAVRRERYLKTTYGHRYIRNRLRKFFSGRKI